MAYIRKLPNVRYPSPLPNKTSSKDFITIKNLFRKVKLLDWVSEQSVIFNSYIIPDESRPDIVADYLYSDPELDYVVILVANITNIEAEWPLSNANLYEYAVNKYGLENLNAIHHYETIEIRDEKDRLILEAGKVVNGPNETFRTADSNGGADAIPEFTIDGPAKRYNGTSNTWYGIIGGEKISYSGETIKPTIGISNYEYEVGINEQKRNIDILRPEYLQIFNNDLEELLNYHRSSQYISRKLITTENTRLFN
tara:strand:- start:255 stop:1016 length:762 start_codon:yes stop_codon:yes gene_type:complete